MTDNEKVRIFKEAWSQGSSRQEVSDYLLRVHNIKLSARSIGTYATFMRQLGYDLPDKRAGRRRVEVKNG